MDIKKIEVLETNLFKLNPQDFIEKVKNLKDKSWYWIYRDNFNIWLDQNNFDSGFYTSGSLVDLFRNYRYKNEMMSDKMQNFIDDSIKINNEYNIELFDKTYYFKQNNEDHSFRVWFDDIKKMKTLLNREIEKQIKKGWSRLSSRELVNSFLNSDVIKGQIDGKGVFSFSTYRNRKKITPESEIPKKCLYQEFINIFDNISEKIFADTKWKELVVLAMVDEVIKNEFIKDNSEIINTIKKEIINKEIKDVVTVLNKYNFTNIPNINILERLMENENFEYTDSRSDGYGHTTGTSWRINFEKRIIISQGFSSDG